MNEKAINQVISEYAIEVANLRIMVSTLRNELEEAKQDLKEKVSEPTKLSE